MCAQDSHSSESSFYTEPIGTVISRSNSSSPNIFEYSFILTTDTSQHDSKKSPIIRQGQYCLVESPEGYVIGVIDQLRVDNQYFTNIQTVKNFELAHVNLQNFFPSDQWECHIADVHLLGTIHSYESFSESINQEDFRNVQRVGFPVNPGNKVYLLDGNLLRNFLGLEESGLNIGNLSNHKIDVKLNLNRLFNKHVAILAQSGAGKSYFISVLLEELLSRPRDLGTPGLILIDVHGEYRFLSKKLENSQELLENVEEIDTLKKIQGKITRFNGRYLQIGVPDLSEFDFQRYQPGISMPQLRELGKTIKICKKKFIDSDQIGYDIKDLISELEENTEINSKIQITLISWLTGLNSLHIFSKYKSPSIFELVKVGDLTILDLSSIVSMRKKQILLHYFISKLFYSRRSGEIAPFILFLEEAHNFLPEAGGKRAIAKNILETIAREGRKFFAQLVLVSQRPVRLSTTALSQCNTQIIMRITNPYDLNHIKQTSESITKRSIDLISTLPTGNALIMGAALNYPIFTKIRRRNFPNLQGELSITDICQTFVKKDRLTAVQSSADTILTTYIQDDFMDLDTFEMKE